MLRYYIHHHNKKDIISYYKIIEYIKGGERSYTMMMCAI